MLRVLAPLTLASLLGAAAAAPTPKLPSGPSLLDIPVIAPTPTPPPPLRCLQKYYEVGATLTSGHWFALLADGTTYAYDDGREKTFEQKLASPDIEDAFETRYPTGAAIEPITDPAMDEGRIRLDPVFKATYGHTEKQLELEKITFLGHHIMVNRRAKDAFLRVGTKLAELKKKDAAAAPFLSDLGGAFNWRNVAGTNRPSAHAFGISVDLNPKFAEYWRWAEWANGKKPPREYSGAVVKPTWKHPIPKSIVDVFESEGFVWGGRWYHFDTMHFEWRPELLDESCYPDGV
ncbi:MAG TPA: M15 family metallopeptidase [bacterium]|nr:M15 family metallopeptidase [bacterium]